MCDLAYAHRLEQADREQQLNAIMAAAGHVEPFNYRAAVEEWLHADVTTVERDELREVLGV